VLLSGPQYKQRLMVLEEWMWDWQRQ
jgi:hypothetical protein